MANDSKLRLLRILELLITRTDEKHPLSTVDIEKALKEQWDLDAYRITIQSDIAALIAALGIWKLLDNVINTPINILSKIVINMC